MGVGMKTKFQWWKWLVVWGFFLLLHFAYEILPSKIILILGEQSEAVVTHMKMVMWAYLFASIVEFFLHRRTIESVSQFVYTRLVVAIVLPWLAITIWHTSIALGILLPEIPWEIVYANVTTALGIYVGLRLEEALDQIKYYRPAFKTVIIMMFLITLLTYISFSFRVPPGYSNYFYWGP
jgi:hypothetical protein